MPFAVRFFLSGFFIILNFCCFAQQGSLAQNAQSPTGQFETRLKASLIAHYRKYPQEKVFIHTSQDVYSTGDTVWYKAYAMAYGKPTELSKIIYVRLTDTAGNLITQNKLPLSEGKAHGNIGIDPKIKTGWYKLSAFTSWMMNFDNEAYYRQEIYIYNPSEADSPKSVKEATGKVYHIAFYPEGGDLVNGNLTKVAFKAFSDDGLPIRVEGAVKECQ